MKHATLLIKTRSLIALIESLYTKEELYGNCPVKDLYLELRKTAYNLKHAPESFVCASC